MLTKLCLLTALCLTSTIADSSAAQEQRVRRSPRGYLSFSDGIGVSSGGSPTGGSGLSQYFRLSGVVRVVGARGIEVSAIRIQELLAPSKQFIDPAGTPETDGLIFSYASLRTQRGSIFPDVLSIGGGFAKRPTSTPGETRTTWAAQVGFESDLSRLPVGWADLSAGGRVLVTPGGGSRIFVAALTLGIRIG